jgi:mannose-6-phosphate isomerase-like protein (cupin superfamily)
MLKYEYRTGDIEKMAMKNMNFREVLSTVPDSFQLVLMSLKQREIIPEESHEKATQFIKIVSGVAVVTMERTPGSKNYETVNLKGGDFVVIPPNTRHEVRNSSVSSRLQLYTIYTPPQHEAGTIEKDQIPEIESEKKGIFARILYKNDIEKFGLFISPQGKAMIIENETAIVHCSRDFLSKEKAVEEIKWCKKKKPDVCPVCCKKECK